MQFRVSDTMLIDIGANYYAGEAKITTTNTDTTATADVTFEMSRSYDSLYSTNFCS